MARKDYLPRMEPQTLISFVFGQDKKPSCNGEWRHMISVTIKTTTKRLIIHEAESTHKYHHKYPLEIHSTRKKNWNKRLGKLEENLCETSDYFTVASCPPMPRPRAHAPNKQGGKPAGQDTSSYTSLVVMCWLGQSINQSIIPIILRIKFFRCVSETKAELGRV